MTDNTSKIDTSKKYPQASDEVAKMFGLNGTAHHPTPVVGNSDPAHAEGFAKVVGNLYVKEPVETHESKTPHLSAHPIEHTLGESAPAAGGNKVFSIFKAVTPYVLVFSVALFIYFYFFSGSSLDLNFSGIFKSQTQAQTPKENSLAQLEQQNLPGYQKWIAEFYYDVSDARVTDPDADNSGNGLSNFQKYLLNLNPKSYDTIGLGMSDSDALQAGINPLTGSKLTQAQNDIIAKYFDFEVISNRQTLAHLQTNGQVAGAETNYQGFGLTPRIAQAAQNSAVGSQRPTIPNSQPAVTQPTNSDLNINTNIPGRLQVPSLKIDAPLVWSQDPKDFDRDLQSGVIHYPGTAMPGQLGTTYISGHSSNYSWAKGSYNHVFTHLNDLADNTSFSITVTTTDGKTHVLHYVVVGRQQYSPGDQAQFKNGGESVVALSTCWPVGSTKYRLVVYGQLTQTENQ